MNPPGIAGIPAAVAAATNPGGLQNETTSDAPASASARHVGRVPDGSDRDDETVHDERADRRLDPGCRHRHLDDAAAPGCRRSRRREGVVGIAAAEHRQHPLPGELVDHVHAGIFVSSSDACGYDRAAPKDRQERRRCGDCARERPCRRGTCHALGEVDTGKGISGSGRVDGLHRGRRHAYLRAVHERDRAAAAERDDDLRRARHQCSRDVSGTVGAEDRLRLLERDEDDVRRPRARRQLVHVAVQRGPVVDRERHQRAPLPRQPRGEAGG